MLAAISKSFQRGGANLLFGQFFPENHMKIKEIRPRGGGTCPWRPLDPPIKSFDLIPGVQNVSIQYFAGAMQRTGLPCSD